MYRILLFIPAKNEGGTIAKVINESLKVLRGYRTLTTTDVLVVNDGSTDNTASQAEAAGALVLSHRDCIGLGAAFEQAVTHATENEYDCMLSIDGDGQFSEKDIPTLLDPLFNGAADCVTGSRFLPSSKTINIPPTKRWGNWLVAQFVSSIIGKSIRDVSCGFRAYNKRSLHHLNLFAGYTYTQKVLLNLGYKNLRILEVPITTTYFQQRKSRIASNLCSYGWNVLNIILSSILFYRPLKLFGLLAALHVLLSGAFLYLPISHYLSTGNITPYKALGVLGLITLLLAFFFLVFGLVMQSISRIQLSVDRLLYHQKRNKR